MKLSEHFSLEELYYSDTARSKKIDNTPNAEQAANLALLVIHVLEPARREFLRPIHVSSGFRNARLNKAVGGVATSQHTRGQAADITCEDLRSLYEIIKKQGYYDQLLFETNKSGTQWIHVSYNPDGCRHVFNDNYKA